MFFYETSRNSVVSNRPTGPDNFNPLRCDAVKSYMGHYRNYLALDFFVNHGTLTEKQQAKLEIEICERKMKFWERQPHFNHAEVIRLKGLLHRGEKVQPEKKAAPKPQPKPTRAVKPKYEPDF